jgi:hypothetical protein
VGMGPPARRGGQLEGTNNRSTGTLLQAQGRLRPALRFRRSEVKDVLSREPATTLKEKEKADPSASRCSVSGQPNSFWADKIVS